MTAAQTQLLRSQSDLVDENTQVTSRLVSLYRALGGGWEIAEGPPAR